jgi:N-formylglutamate amidohydrolase
MDRDSGHSRVDFVLGDCHGTACAPEVIATAGGSFEDLGYSVSRNTPYSGAFVTRHYGQPARAVHALQIEINRDLYMDEDRISRRSHLSRLAEDMRSVIDALARIDESRLTEG